MTEERIRKLQIGLNETGTNNYDDISYDKRVLLQDIYKDPDIFEVLHNSQLTNDSALPEDYYNKNIFSFLKIPDTQSTVKNFLCFEVNIEEESYNNYIMVNKQVTFRTVSHESDVETPYGVDRQDLLAMIIKDRYCWSNILGGKMKKIYDVGKIAENGYYYRDIRFKVIAPNSLQNGTSTNLLDRKRGKYAPDNIFR